MHEFNQIRPGEPDFYVLPDFRGCSREAPQTEEIPYVMVAQPLTTHHEQKSYAGEVQARQQTALAFRVGGQVTARLAEVGDRVRAGQVLARLDVSDAQLQSNAAGPSWKVLKLL